MIPDTPECFASHLGLWAMHPPTLREALAQVQSGTLKSSAPQAATEEGYEVAPGQIALISLAGPLQKARSKYAGTSTLDARRQLRHAARSESVSAILLLTESPGGAASGTHELAEDVKAAAAAKPLYAHVQDMGASAAYWAIASAHQISANGPAQVGSIGTYAVLYDESERFEAEGVKVHVVSTGDSKGAGAPGTEITEEVLEEAQEQVDHLNSFFLDAVREGRGLTGEQMAAVTSGRVFSSDQAVSLGLVDVVQSLDETIEQIRADVAPKDRSRLRRAQMRQRDVDLDL